MVRGYTVIPGGKTENAHEGTTAGMQSRLQAKAIFNCSK
jgi:hypothetical protein